MNEISNTQVELNLINMESSYQDGMIQFTGEQRVLRSMWYAALEDIKKNYCMDIEGTRMFAAGGYNNHKNWNGLTFNRDTCYSGVLALNALYPKEILACLKKIREIRGKLKFACMPGTKLVGVNGVEVFDLEFEEFKARFHKNSAVFKTDDVVWLWCAYDLLMKSSIDEWDWLYETGKQNFEELYTPFYDPNDGLYFGQPTFIDVGCNGYPENFGYRTLDAYNNGVWVKASSTNSLYYKALCVMAEAARRVGKPEEAPTWERQADKLKNAIRNELRFDNGTFSYFKHKDGELEQRREVLGTAFPVLFGIVESEDAKSALAGYPITSCGAPLLHPFYDNEKVLHNNSMWPFADTFLLLAFEKAYGESYVEENLLIMINSVKNGHLYEFRNLLTNQMSGSVAQLWTIVGFVNTCIRGGLTELSPIIAEIN